MNVLEPRFAIDLIPIDNPKAAHGITIIITPVRSPDGDTLNLDRHVHTRVHVVPGVRNVLQEPPVLASPVRTALPSWPDDLPERALGNIGLVASLLPLLPLFLQRQPHSFQYSTFVLERDTPILHILVEEDPHYEL